MMGGHKINYNIIHIKIIELLLFDAHCQFTVRVQAWPHKKKKKAFIW